MSLFPELTSHCFHTVLSLFVPFFSSLHYFQLPSITLFHDNFFFFLPFLLPEFRNCFLIYFLFLIFFYCLLWSLSLYQHNRPSKLIRCFKTFFPHIPIVCCDFSIQERENSAQTGNCFILINEYPSYGNRFFSVLAQTLVWTKSEYEQEEWVQKESSCTNLLLSAVEWRVTFSEKNFLPIFNLHVDARRIYYWAVRSQGSLLH
jgi:hypothetical protein